MACSAIVRRTARDQAAVGSRADSGACRNDLQHAGLFVGTAIFEELVRYGRHRDLVIEPELGGGTRLERYFIAAPKILT